jgi:hypothetical protein
MIFPNKSINLIKVAEYFGDLEKVIYKFNIKMIPYTKNPKNIKGFMLYEPQSYLLTVHQDKDDDKTGYNLIFKITSHSSEFNDFAGQEFTQKTGIILRDAPDYLYKFLQNDMGFQLCEQYGEKAMRILKGNL